MFLPGMNVGSVGFMDMSKEMKLWFKKGKTSAESFAACVRTVTLLVKDLIWRSMGQPKLQGNTIGQE